MFWLPYLYELVYLVLRYTTGMALLKTAQYNTQNNTKTQNTQNRKKICTWEQNLSEGSNRKMVIRNFKKICKRRKKWNLDLPQIKNHKRTMNSDRSDHTHTTKDMYYVDDITTGRNSFNMSVFTMCVIVCTRSSLGDVLFCITCRGVSLCTDNTFLTLRINFAMGPTQPPVQWVPGYSPGVKRPGRGFGQPVSKVE